VFTELPSHILELPNDLHTLLPAIVCYMCIGSGAELLKMFTRLLLVDW